jgi:hypothetical protein
MNLFRPNKNIGNVQIFEDRKLNPGSYNEESINPASYLIFRGIYNTS